MTERIALVTNAADFAGPAAVTGLLNAGWRVIAHDRSFNRLDIWAAFEQSRSRLQPLSGDQPEAVVEAAFEVGDRLDAIISNDHMPAPAVSASEEGVDALRENLERLVVEPYRLAAAALPRFSAQDGGNLVMITSNRMRLPLPGGAGPDAARAAANALVRSLAIEAAPHHVAVNAIAPNFFYSEAFFPAAVFKESAAGREYVKSQVPLGRLGEIGEMGELVAFLAGADARFLTGAVIDFAGGWPMGPVRPTV